MYTSIIRSMLKGKKEKKDKYTYIILYGVCVKEKQEKKDKQKNSCTHSWAARRAPMMERAVALLLSASRWSLQAARLSWRTGLPDCCVVRPTATWTMLVACDGELEMMAQRGRVATTAADDGGVETVVGTRCTM